MKCIFNNTPARLGKAPPRARSAAGLSRSSLTLVLTAMCSTGCSDGRDEAPSRVEAGPAYLVGTRVWSDTTTTSYFHVVPSLDAGTVVDPARAVEVSGAAKLFAVDEIGWFAVGGGEQPTITRYTLGDTGRLEEGDSISLQPYGVDGLWDTLYVVSETKMYYPDREGHQLVVINPKEMLVEGVIQLPQTERAPYLPVYGYTPLLRDGKLLFTVGWFDWTNNDAVLGETGLVVLDTQTDTVERFDVDSRCGGVTTGVVLDSGDTYFVTAAIASAAHRLKRLPSAPCALRVAAGADAFDPEFSVAMRDITGTHVSGEPIPAGGSELFLRVFDERLATVEEGHATYELTGQSAWHWWRWNVETGEAGPVSTLGPSTSDVLWFDLDGRVFGTETTEDYARTTLIELTADGGPREALTAPGFLHAAARVR